MAEPTYNLCDVCGEKCNRACRLFVETDVQFNGNEYDPNGRYVDLCPKHQADAIKALISKPGSACRADYERGMQLLKFLDKLAATVKKAT